MQELIKVATNANGQQVVSARELHDFLGAGSNVNTWFKNQAERAMLQENVDYVCFQNSESDGRGGQNKLDYALTLSSAKEIAMLNGGEKGKEARTYFIECERMLMQPKVLSRLEILEQAILIEKENIALKKQVLLDKPKVEFYDDVIDAKETFDIAETAKLLKLPYGRNTLFLKLKEANVLMSDNEPYQKYIGNYFVVVESKWNNHKTGSSHAVKQTRTTQKGLDWLQKNKQKFTL